jgi:hypothetical protein
MATLAVTRQATDTSHYNSWYRRSQACSVVATHASTALQATALGIIWHLGGWWLTTPVVARIVYQLFRNNKGHTSHATIDLVISSLNTLSKQVPPIALTNRTPATLASLLLKFQNSNADSLTRDDYRYLIEQILMNSTSLFGWYSLTGHHRAPFDRLLNALEHPSEKDIQTALNAVLAKLIELRQTRADPQTEAYKTKMTHPRLQELIKALLLMNSGILTNTPLSPEQQRDCCLVLHNLSQDPEGLSLMTGSSYTIPSTAVVQENLLLLLRSLNAQNLTSVEIQQLRTTLKNVLAAMQKLLPIPNPLHTTLNLHLSDSPLVAQTHPIPLHTPSTALSRLRTLVQDNPIRCTSLFQIIRTIALRYDLRELEAHLRNHLKTHYRQEIELRYPLQENEAADSERPFNEFLGHQTHLDRMAVVNGLVHAFIRAIASRHNNQIEIDETDETDELYERPLSALNRIIDFISQMYQ